MTTTHPAAVASRLPNLLADLEALVRCESPSADLAAIRQSADLIAVIGADRLGVAPDRIEIDGCSHLRWRFGPGPNRVAILAHHDTVWPLGSLATHPWSVDGRRGPRAGHGRHEGRSGAGVPRARRAASTAESGWTACACWSPGTRRSARPTSRALIEDEARGCAACFVLEGAGPGGSLKTGRKGTSLYRVEITGRAAHAGAEPEKGINAAVELAHLILATCRHGRPAAGHHA